MVQFVVLLILVGSLQGLVLALILSKKERFKKKSNLYLSIFILAFSLSNLHYVASIFGITQKFEWFKYASFPWTFLIPVVFYFFIKYLLNPEYKLSRHDRWLFVPFTIQIIWHLALMIVSILKIEQSEYIQNLIFLIDIKLETVISLGLNLIFIPLVYRTISQYENKLKDNYSEISKSSLEWLRRLVLSLIAIWVIWAIPAIYQVVTGNTTPILDLILWCMMSASIYWIGYATYFRNDIFVAERTFPSVQQTQEISKFNSTIPIIQPKQQEQSKPSSSKDQDSNESKEATVPIDKIDLHFSKMIEIIEIEKLFTNPEFNLSMLSDKCQLSGNYLSQIINKKTGRNFYSLINNYRVEEVKSMLTNKDYSHYNLLSIGLEAGFKSKSSFYKIFKEKVNLTPSQYQKKFQ